MGVLADPRRSDGEGGLRLRPPAQVNQAHRDETAGVGTFIAARSRGPKGGARRRRPDARFLPQCLDEAASASTIPSP